MFYGEGKEQLAEELSDDIAAGRVYHGGGPSGYIGAATGAFKEKEILGFVTKLKHRFAYSFHTFMFPFQWRINGYDEKMFSEQISLGNILYSTESDWERSTKPDNDDEANDLYDERNYFYKFVHDALYDSGKDNSLIRHFERTKPRHSGVTYVIDCGKKVYELKVAAINLNLYSTGVGLLSFYLYNESYPEPEDVFRINQVGRRVFPPFFASVKGQRSIIAEAIEICGLNGGGEGYREDFKLYTNEMPNQPASFIENLIHEVATNIDIKPVIDDRMFVLCWYKNDEWAKKFSEDRYDGMLYSSDWYEFVFVDDLGQMSCQNDAMQRELIQKATYSRWQKWCSIYGMSRYSLVYLTNNGAAQFAPYLLGYFETQYVRMAELILVQKASVLRFSAEVTNLSNMETSKGFSGKVSSLYKEYIRFINQIHFREVSAQDQGIEMYQMLYDTMNLKTHVEKLDEEIGELYNYVSLTEDRKSGNTMSLLTWIATISVPVTVITGIFGMNNSLFCCDVPNSGWYNDGRAQLILAFGLAALISIVLYIIYNYRKSK